jgi:hypothetical protein
MIVSYEICEDSIKELYAKLKESNGGHVWFSSNGKKFSFYYNPTISKQNFNNLLLSIRSGKKNTSQEDVLIARLVIAKAFEKIKSYENF